MVYEIIDYSWKGLVELLRKSSDSVLLSSIKKFTRKCCDMWTRIARKTVNYLIPRRIELCRSPISRSPNNSLVDNLWARLKLCTWPLEKLRIELRQ